MKPTLLIAMTSALILSSCGSKDSQVQPSAAAPVSDSRASAGTVIENSGKNGEWIVEEKTSRDGEVTFRTESLPADRVEEFRKREYRATQLQQVPIDPSFNALLFKVDDAKTKKAVYIAPKLYAYAGKEANKTEPLINDDKGEMTLFFPIILIDGLSDKIESPNRENALITLPENLLVKKKDDLIKFLNKLYAGDGEQNLAALPGCPKEIVLTVAGRRFPIDRDLYLTSDYCHYNKPFTISITLPKSEAMWLLEEGLYSGAAKVSAIFETRVPYVVTKLKIEMNKQKIFEDLSIKLKLNFPYAESEITTEIQKIVKEQAAKISIQGDLNEHLNAIIAQAIDHFFEKMPADPKKEDMSCGNKPVCFKLAYKKQNYDDNFSVEWTHTTNVLSGQNILTETILSSLFDDSVSVLNVKNDGTKKTTGITVYNGAKIDLKLTSLLVDKAIQDVKKERKDNNVVIGETKVPCLMAGGGEGGGGNPGREGIGGGHREGPCTTTQKIYQNQWTEIFTYDVKPVTESILENPIGKAEEVLNNIGFEFQWNEGGKTVSQKCPANLFQRHGDGRKFLITIENVPGCTVFTKNSVNRPIMALYNASQSKAEGIKKGFRTVNWQNQVTADTLRDIDYTLNSVFDAFIMRRGAIRSDPSSKPGVRLL